MCHHRPAPTSVHRGNFIYNLVGRTNAAGDGKRITRNALRRLLAFDFLVWILSFGFDPLRDLAFEARRQPRAELIPLSLQIKAGWTGPASALKVRTYAALNPLQLTVSLE
jgi:hypothetical protein